MKNVRHLFFDLDHTLWDFEKNSSETLHELFFELKLDHHVDSVEEFIATYQKINAKYWDLYNHGKITKQEVRTGRFKETFEIFNFSDSSKRAEQLGNAYIERSPQKKHIFEGAHETLAYLKNKYELHIITNGFKEVQHQKLANTALAPYFNLVLCSEEVGVNKPNRLVFETALTRTNAIPTESVMIGDNPETDIKGAQNCGFHTILFNPNQVDFEVDSLEIQALKELIQLF